MSMTDRLYLAIFKRSGIDTNMASGCGRVETIYHGHYLLGLQMETVYKINRHARATQKKFCCCQ